MNQSLQDTLEPLRNKCLLNMYVNHSYWFSSHFCLIEMKWFPMAYYGGPGHGGVNGHYYHVFGTVRNLPVPPHDLTQSCVAPILSSTIECDGLKSCILSLSTCNYTDVNAVLKITHVVKSWVCNQYAWNFYETFEEQGWTSGIMFVLKTVKICLTRLKKSVMLWKYTIAKEDPVIVFTDKTHPALHWSPWALFWLFCIVNDYWDNFWILWTAYPL